MSEYAKNIQTIEDMWKKRIELLSEGGGRMSEYIIEMGNSSYRSTSGLLCADVSQLKAEVVRCRDCKHYTDDEMEYYHYCGSWCEQVTPDGFCAWGERRADHD